MAIKIHLVCTSKTGYCMIDELLKNTLVKIPTEKRRLGWPCKSQQDHGHRKTNNYVSYHVEVFNMSGGGELYALGLIRL